jgi:isochorismate synthase
MSVLSEVKPFTIRETELLFFLFEFVHAHNYSIALWQLPGKKTRLVVLAKEVKHVSAEQSLEELEPGFVFAPFDKRIDPLFLPAELQFRLDEELLAAPANTLESRSSDWLKENYKPNENPGILPYFHPVIATPDSTADYINVVKRGIKAIEEGVFEKVVPSRSKTVGLPHTFNVVHAFLKLCKAYQQAFVSLVSSPKTGTWMGASPEELVRVEDKTIFRTVALAGTQPFHEGVNLRNVAWTQKEIEEQALVERYIISCFKKIRLREYDEFGPKTGSS